MARRSILLRFILPALAAGSFAFATYSVIAARPDRSLVDPVSSPPMAPAAGAVAGLGLIEPVSEAITIGTPLSGVVASVAVQAGDMVRAGDTLFTLDTREAEADVLARRAALAVAVARLAELDQSPRAEDLPPAEARLAAAEAARREAQADLADRRAQLQFFENVVDRRAISQDDLSRRRFAVQAAEGRLAAQAARVAEAQAALAHLRAGTWEPVRATQRATVAQLQAQLVQAETTLERLTVRAPIDGTVLQVRVRTGEFAQAGILSQALMVLGDLKSLHVRVDIDESEAPRLTLGAPAQISLRGRGDTKVQASFVRVEPLMVAKRSLSGDITERIDTRVMQVLYRLDPAALPTRIGQLVDVYIDGRAAQ